MERICSLTTPTVEGGRLRDDAQVEFEFDPGRKGFETKQRKFRKKLQKPVNKRAVMRPGSN